MFTQNEYVMMQVNKDAYNNAYREAETLRQLRRAGLLRTTALPRFACRCAVVIGRALVMVGRRLERLERVVTPA